MSLRVIYYVNVDVSSYVESASVGSTWVLSLYYLRCQSGATDLSFGLNSFKNLDWNQWLYSCSDNPRTGSTQLETTRSITATLGWINEPIAVTILIVSCRSSSGLWTRDQQRVTNTYHIISSITIIIMIQNLLMVPLLSKSYLAKFLGRVSESRDCTYTCKWASPCVPVKNLCPLWRAQHHIFAAIRQEVGICCNGGLAWLGFYRRVFCCTFLRTMVCIFLGTMAMADKP